VNFTNFLHGTLLPNILNILFGTVMFGFGLFAVRRLEPGGCRDSATIERMPSHGHRPSGNRTSR